MSFRAPKDALHCRLCERRKKKSEEEKLSKKVCKSCRIGRGLNWDWNSEKLWEINTSRCMISTEKGTVFGGAFVNEPAPEYCPFVLEHLLDAEQKNM